MSRELTVEVWSDVICPWCWIGKRRLEHALAGFANRDQVRIVYRAFRLTPGLEPQHSANLLTQRLGSPERAAAAMAQVAGEAAKEGLEYHLAEAWVGDTLHLHRLLKFAAEKGQGEQAIERFYRAGFTQRQPLFERATQLRLMADIGLEPEAVEAVLDSDIHAAAVAEDQRTRQTLGGSGVPFFLIDGSYAISGAQPREAFLRALHQAWDERPAVMTQGAVCGPDGCAAP